MQLDVLGSSAKALAAVRLRILAVAAYGEHLSKGPKPVASAEVLQLRRVTACLLASVLDSGPAGPHSMSLHGLEARLHLACANAWQVVCSAHASTSIWQEIADGSILKLQQGDGLLGQELSLPTSCVLLDPGALEVRAIQVAVQAAPDEPSPSDHDISSNSPGTQGGGQPLPSGSPGTLNNHGQQQQHVASPQHQQQQAGGLQAAVNAVYSGDDPLVRARRVLAAELATRTSGPLGPASILVATAGDVLKTSAPEAWPLLTAKAQEAGVSRVAALLRPSDGVLVMQHSATAKAGAVLLDVGELRRRAALLTAGRGEAALAPPSTAGVSGSELALPTRMAITSQPASPASYASVPGQVFAKTTPSPPAAQPGAASQVQQPIGQNAGHLVPQQQTPVLASGPAQSPLPPSPPAVAVLQQQQQGAEVGADLDPTALALAAAVLAATWPQELVMTLADLAMVTAPAIVVQKSGGRHRCLRSWLEVEVMRVCRQPIVEAMLAPEQLATNTGQARSLIKRHPSVIEDVPGGALVQLKLSTLSAAITQAAEAGVLPDLAILPFSALHQRALPYLRLLQQLQSEQERVGEGGATGWGIGQSTLRRLLQQSALYVNGLVQSSAGSTPVDSTSRGDTSSLGARPLGPPAQVQANTISSSQHVAGSPAASVNSSAAGGPAASVGMQAAPHPLRDLLVRMYPGDNDLSNVKQGLALRLLRGVGGPLGKHSVSGSQLGLLMNKLLPSQWASVRSKYSKLVGMFLPSDGVLVAKPANGNIAVLLDIEQLKRQAPQILREAEQPTNLDATSQPSTSGKSTGAPAAANTSLARPHNEAAADNPSPELGKLRPLICRMYSGADDLSQVKKVLALELLQAGIEGQGRSGPLGRYSIAGPQLGELMHRLLPTQWASVRSKHSKIFDIFQPSDGVLVADYAHKNVAVMLNMEELKRCTQAGRLPSLPQLQEVHIVAATPTKSDGAPGQRQVSEQSQPTSAPAPAPPPASPGPSRQLGPAVEAPQRSTSLDPEAMALVAACLAATLPKNDFLMVALTLAMVTAPSHVAKQMGGRTHCLTAWLHTEVRRVMSHKDAGELQHQRQLPAALNDAWDQLSTTPLLSFLPNGKAQLQLEQILAATTEAAQGTGLPELSKRRWGVVHVQAHPYLHALQRLQAHSPGLFAVLTRCAAAYVQSLVLGNSKSGPVGEGVAEIKAILLALL